VYREGVPNRHPIDQTQSLSGTQGICRVPTAEKIIGGGQARQIFKISNKYRMIRFDGRGKNSNNILVDPR
jgi:hypothetical protein